LKKIAIISMALLLVILSACSTPKENSSPVAAATNTPASEAPQQTKAPEAASDIKATENELTLENDGVNEEEFLKALEQFPGQPVEKIATTSVPLTEMLYLLGITPVGVPTSTNPIPAAFDSVTRIGSPMAPDLEVVTDIEPELLLGAESLRSTLEKNLEGLDLKTAYLKTDSFNDLKLSFKVLGTYFNKQEEMNKVLSSILAKENELMKAAEGKQLPKAMLMIGTSDSFMVMSESSYLGSLVSLLGADNIATSLLKVTSTYSAINLEDILVADPDIIFVLASGDHGANQEKFEQEVAKNDAWTKLSAYKNDNIHILDYSIFGVTSISNAEKALTTISDYFFK